MQVSARWTSICFVTLLGLAGSVHAAGGVVVPAAPASILTPPASFDCAKAAGIDTDIICSDALLRQADASLGRLFQQVVALNGDQARIDALRADERNWINVRNTQCNVSKALKLNDDDRAEYVDCFLSAYDARMADLSRMKADPHADPTSVSNPIRKSSFDDATPRTHLPPGALTSTGILALSLNQGALTFRNDGTLFAIGALKSPGDAEIYSWNAGQPAMQVKNSPAAVPATSTLCATSSELLLIPAQRKDDVLVLSGESSRMVAAWALPSATQRRCGLVAERAEVGSDDGQQAIDLGPVDHPLASSTRFVTLTDEQGAHDLVPPIRIDRRFPLRAYFDTNNRQFVVSPNQPPAALKGASEREWAKTNCGVFWQVDAKTHNVTSNCVPYGSYATNAASSSYQPLPSRAGLLFAIPGKGLYKVSSTGAAQRILALVDAPVLAPDGCTVAFIGAAAKEGAPRPVMALNACKLDAP